VAATLLLGCPRGTAVPSSLDRFHRVSGGDAWGQVHFLVGTADVSLGGLTGTMETIDDVDTGRHWSQGELGPLRVADGDDGHAAWQQTSNGEVLIEDAPESVADARTLAWLTRRGYFRTDGATYRPLDRGGLLATPDGGSPVELWFDPATGLLARSVTRRGTEKYVTTYDDYRDVAGVRLPFHIVVDNGDPRSVFTATYRELEARDHVDETAFAPPSADDGRLTFVGDARRTELPFELINNHIYIDAIVDDQPVRMLVDTGGANILTPAAAARRGLETEGKLAVGGVGAEKVDLSVTRARTLAVGDLRLADPIFHVVDFGSLADVEGVDFDGLVGFELFNRLIVRIDYPASRLTLIRRDDFTPPAGAIAVPFDIRDSIPIVEGSIDGVPARLLIDTGSRASLTLNSPFVREHDLVDRYQPRFEAVTGWGVGGGVRGSPVRIGEIHIGDAVVKEVAADLFTGDKGAMAAPDSSANVGSGLLRRFAVTFDYEHRTMYLEPAASPPPRDVYDRAGMFFRRDGDAILVLSVTPGGAAEKAGVAADDRIVAIDGAAISTHALHEWRAILAAGPVGERHVVAIQRGTTKRRDLTIVLSELLP
jgi:hypothetical protein